MKDKIPFYNIVNMFFVGSIFSFVLAVLFNDYIDLPIVISITQGFTSILKAKS